MAVAADVSLYLAGQSLGLTVGSTGNLFNAPFPPSAPNASVTVIEYAGGPALRCMGASLSAPVAEYHRFQVVVRDTRNNFSTAQTLAESISNKLDHLGDTTLGSVRYLNVRALQPPFPIGEDGNGRIEFSTNFECWKERG